MTAETKYGQIRGGHNGFSLPMGAAETFYSKSGRFVKNDVSGRGELAVAGSASLQGFVRDGQPADGAGGGGLDTHATTEGDSKFWCIIDLTAVFRLPLAYTATYTANYDDNMIGERCDLVVISEVQYVDVTNASQAVVRIVGGKAATAVFVPASVNGLCQGDGYVDVMLIESKLYGQNVA